MLNEKLWVDKYRPKNLGELILPDSFINKFESYLNEKSIPHLLLAGKPGSGKTTISRIITDNILNDENDLLYINGSKDNGVDFVRTTINSFLSVPPFSSKIKIVWVDEADYLSLNAQSVLRAMIEQFQEYARFIFTVNQINKLMDPIISRFQLFEFKNLPNSNIKNHLIKILNNEGITTINSEVDSYLDNVIKMNYPDVRKIIGILQSNFLTNETIDTKVVSGDVESELLNNIKELLTALNNKNMTKIKIILDNITKKVNNEVVNYIMLYESIFSMEEIPYYLKIIVGESLEKFPDACSQHIHFLTCLYKLVKGYIAFNKLDIKQGF